MEALKWIVDGILLAIFVFTVFKSVKTGFVRSVSGILSLVCAAILAGRFSFLLDGILERRVFSPLVEGIVSENLQGVLASLDDTVSTAVSSVADAAKALADKAAAMGVPVGEIPAFDGAGTDLSAYADTLTAEIAAPIAERLADVSACLILFILFFIVIRLVLKLLEGIVKLPLLKEVNSVLGAVTGVILGVVFTWLSAQVLSLIFGVLCTNGTLPASVCEGYLFRLLTQ